MALIWQWVTSSSIQGGNRQLTLKGADISRYPFSIDDCFCQCWNDEDTDNIDLIFDGGLWLVNYVEVENADVITRIGFEPYMESPGGVVYDDLKITETETTLGNVIIQDDEAMTLSGGFSMVFTSP